MAFIDILALEQVTLLLAAVVLAYVGVLGLFAMRRNDALGVKETLRSAAVPVTSIGAIATVFGVWGEMVWQYPAMGKIGLGYNIFFNDIYLLFGVSLLVVGVSMALSLKLQYAGLFALVAGGVTISYGYVGWQMAYTKDPLETFLLYGAFGLAGVLSLPATFVVDHFLANPVGTPVPVGTGVPVFRRNPSFQGSTRAVQPIVPMDTSGNPDPATTVLTRLRLPLYVSIPVLVFVATMALAAVAALFYLDSTLPAHMASAP
jgi:putative membrane protein